MWCPYITPKKLFMITILKVPMIIGRYLWWALVVYNCKARPNQKRKKVVQRKNCREVGR
jgi:hypothetical protein